MNFIFSYIFTILYILTIEFIWLYLINKKTYSLLTKNIQKTPMIINYYYTAIAYIIILFSVFTLSIPFIKSKIKKNDNLYQIIYKSLLYGSLVGFYIYGIYNFTSISIYKNYDLTIAITDTVWGMFLYATSSLLFIYISLI